MSPTTNTSPISHSDRLQQTPPSPRTTRRATTWLATLVVGLAVLAGCSSNDGPEAQPLVDPITDDTPEVADKVDAGAELAVGPAAIEDTTIVLPDGRVPEPAGQDAAQAYINYSELRDRGELTQADGEAVASGSALDALLFAAGVGIEGDGSTTTVGVIDVEQTGSTVVLLTCDVADLGENSLLDDGTRLIDQRAHRVTVESSADGPRVAEVARLTSALREGRFCAPVDAQRELINQVLSAFEVYTAVAAGEEDADRLNDVFEDPIRSFLQERLADSPGTVVGEVELSMANVINYIPNFRGQVRMCLVYPDGLQVLDADGEIVDAEPAGNEFGFIASVTKAEPGQGDFEIVDMDFAPTTPVC